MSDVRDQIRQSRPNPDALPHLDHEELVRRARRRTVAGRSVAGLAVVVIAAGGVLAVDAVRPAADVTIGSDDAAPSESGAPSVSAGEELGDRLAQLTEQRRTLERDITQLHDQIDTWEQRQEAGDETASNTLKNLEIQLQAHTIELGQVRNQIFALESQLAEDGLRPDPAERAEQRAIDADRELVDDLIAFADNPGPATLEELPLADTVQLGLAEQLMTQRTPDKLTDPAAWTLDTEQHRGHSGPFNPLDALADSEDIRVLAGPHPHCSSPPVPAPKAVIAARRVSVQPTTTESCQQWWTVDLFLDDNGRIVAITYDFWEP